MKFSQYFLPTLKEVPSDSVIPSHILMVRAGMIRQLTSGVYSYLPLGLRVFKKVEKVVREEMNAIGGCEFYLPALSPNELWAETGRLEDYGDDIFRIKNRELVLAPTHEEVFTSLAKPNLISYKHLPQIWYQIQTKFRNEPRPRGGVLRGRQFTMKDAYSFDSTWEGLDESYQKHAQAYRNIFTRCGLKFFTVSAFSGAMGGSESEEFMVEADSGEDTVVVSNDNTYASNIEVASSLTVRVERKNSGLPTEEFHTPNIKSIDELAGFLSLTDRSRLAKSRLFVIPAKDNLKKDEYVLALVCGDDEFSETKLAGIFPGIRPGHPEELMEIAGADAGSIGPLNFKNKDVKFAADLRLEDADELISGACRNDYHMKNIDLKRDVPGIKYYDLRQVKDGEKTSDGKSVLRMTKAIEVGHIFKLGTRYAEALGAKYLDVNGKENVIIMGSYGIGIERIAAAYIEQNHDKDGIVWSGELAPFKIHLVSVNKKADAVKAAAEKLYNELTAKGYEVLFDDRDDISPGVKFKDADLIGIPLQLVVSEKNMKNNEIEVKFRKTGERIKVNFPEILEKLPGLVENL
ncbi:MAG TPA: proline--tRNA ligase [Ignavibacteria bacterium]|nr:proline--tRNA ligase [Bacteroidota bacterium]HRF66620.1 proline--tRNA ligase [Ignavibacteria bacterium]HRJ04474.1 proline--tRNA ligase [Ignavibacteria bacterium]HRJ86901.1 proline--tRNA ligase [Ignavibacteria bacterium]